RVPSPLPRPADFRTVDGRPSKISHFTALAIRQARFYVDSISELLDEHPERARRFAEPRLTLSNNAAQAALRRRAEASITIDNQLQLRSESEAFRVWRDWVESKGVYVFVLNFPTDDCRGFSLDGETPAI